MKSKYREKKRHDYVQVSKTELNYRPNILSKENEKDSSESMATFKQPKWILQIIHIIVQEWRKLFVIVKIIKPWQIVDSGEKKLSEENLMGK